MKGMEGLLMAPQAAPPGHVGLQGANVLVVDDNPDALETVAATLAAAGAKVTTAGSGADAVRAHARVRPDVLICDLAMPQMDGFEVLREVRRQDAAVGTTTPAIALTAHASADSIAQTKTAGFSLHVTKPFDAQTLLRAVSAALAFGRSDSTS